MDAKELKKILSDHKEWLKDSSSGCRAELRWADLSGADLSGAELRWADLRWADLSGADLSGADLSGADLSGADLSGAELRWADLSWADLSGADLRRADLSGADLDFSCLPLWCGGAHFKADMKLVRQLMAHICTVEIVDADEDIKKAVDAIRGEASKSHRASDLGLEAPHA